MSNSDTVEQAIRMARESSACSFSRPDTPTMIKEGIFIVVPDDVDNDQCLLYEPHSQTHLFGGWLVGTVPFNMLPHMAQQFVEDNRGRPVALAVRMELMDTFKIEQG